VIRDHRFYEMQSALSASGHLTDSELEELEQHVSQCVSCRNCMVEMAAVSRELFLTQIGPGNRETPKGMQDRFIQRAVTAGIPFKLERASFTGFDLRFARVAAITVVLALLISLGWEIAPTLRVQQASGEFPSKTEPAPKALSESIPRPSGGRVGHTALVYESRTKRRAAARGRGALKGSPAVSYGKVSHPYLAQNGPLFVNQEVPASLSNGGAFWSERLTQSYVADGVHSASHSPTTRAYAASLFGRKWDSKPEERSFHLDLALASLTRANSPLNDSASGLAPNLKFTIPVFHIDPTRSW
jgi:hypothetical protein